MPTNPQLPPNSLSNASKIPETRRRSSLIENEHMFSPISQERPLSKPTLSGKDTSGHNQGRSDHKEHNGPNQNQSRTGAKRDDPVITRLEMYKECVYTGAHYLGKPSPMRFPADEEAICLYAHEIFSNSVEEQAQVMDSVRNEPFPLTIVNTKVRKAKGLQGSKPNVTLDPYCVVTIETENSSVVFQLGLKEWQELSTESPAVRNKHLKTKHLRPPPEQRTQRYESVPEYIKTPLQRHKNSPQWDQRFQCLSLRPSIDKVTVEVWDHSIGDKSVAESIRGIEKNEKVDKSLKAANQNSENKTGDTFLGKVSLKVSGILCDGSDQWYDLTYSSQGNDVEVHGKIRLQIWLVHAYRHGRHHKEVAEPKVMLGQLWDYVLNAEKSKFKDSKQWNGSIPSAATCLLFQYALQNGISEDTHAVIRWNAYAKHDLAMSALKEIPGKDPKLTTETHKESKTTTEENVLKLVTDKIIPIIRNHLNESDEKLNWALTSYRNCVEMLDKYNSTEVKARILRLVQSAMRICILEWYQRTYAHLVPTQGQAEKGQYVGSVAEVIKEVNSLIRLGEVKFSPMFSLTASIEYLSVVYDELQKMVIHDVESICWLFFQFYRDSKKLRRILLENKEKDRIFCANFVLLFKETQKFVLAQVDIFKGLAEYPFLVQYHRWFRPTLVLWLGFALIRGSLMICNTIHVDNHVQDAMATLTSSSALDTANVFAQLVKFWSDLKWPDIPEGYVIINFLMDVIASYTVLYAELKHAKLEKEGYYDPTGRFTISERLCTAINNIEYVKGQMETITEQAEYKRMVQSLEATCGKTPTVLVYKERAKERQVKTVLIVNRHIERILNNVGEKISKELSGLIREWFRTMASDKKNLGSSLDPLFGYLDDNIMVLQHTLLPVNFRKVLQLLWNLVFKEMHDASHAVTVDSTDTQMALFDAVINVIPQVTKYFQGGQVPGLSRQDMDTLQYKDSCDLFNHFTRSTEELILMYYHETAQHHLNYKGKATLGTLRVRVGFWNDKLTAEVLSASKLTAHDVEQTFLKYFHTKHPTSDSMVELELRPKMYFSKEKKEKTEIKWKNLNPVFEETFYWQIKPDDCRRGGATLVLTVKDYDLMSKDAFLGEALVPLHIIPGISNSPEPQPMVLPLHEVDKENHALLVLQSRKWDENARQFTTDQMRKFVESVTGKR